MTVPDNPGYSRLATCYCGHPKTDHEHYTNGMLTWCAAKGCTCDIYETDDDPPPKLFAQNDKPIAMIRWPWVY